MILKSITMILKSITMILKSVIVIKEKAPLKSIKSALNLILKPHQSKVTLNLENVTEIFEKWNLDQKSDRSCS